MTQPVQEPSAPREASAQAFQSRRLLRRPAPFVNNVAYPTHIDLLDPFIGAYLGFDSFNGSYTTTLRVALGTGAAQAPWGYYTESGAADQDVELVLLTRLGPRGSVWIPMFDLYEGTDCGMFKIGINAISENGTGEWATADQTGLIADPDDDTPYDGHPTFFPGDVGPTDWGWNWDSYQPANGWDVGQGNAIRIMANDGVIPTTMEGVLDPDGFWMDINSGSGIYAIRIVSDGKNASSTNYRKRFGSFRMIRLTEDFQAVG